MVLVEEKEVHISKVYGESKWRVYTTDNKYMTKLDKISTAVDITYDKGEVFSKTYLLDEKQVLLRNTPKKKELTEEQKAKLAERLQKRRE